MIDSIASVLNQVLQLVHGVVGSYLVAITLLTIAIKAVLHPLTRTQLKSMKAMASLAPQIEVLRRKYKEDPKQLNIETMNLYRSSKVNPFSGCLPLILQLPVLWALFALLRKPGIFGGEMFAGIPLESQPWPLQVFIDHPLLILIPILSGVTTYWQQQMTITDPQQARMFIFMPFFVAYLATQFPVALSIYWIVSTVAYIAEYYLVVGRPRKVGVAPRRDQRQGPAKPQGQQ
ncbi:MAG: YidC/Oxa1 family membrane protein insertase [Armatimonadota bacterium]